MLMATGAPGVIPMPPGVKVLTERRLAGVGAMLLVVSLPVVTLSQANAVRGSVDESNPLPPTLQFRPLSREAAVAFNRALPFVNEPRQPASPFVFAGTPETRARALECLTSAVYYE